MDNLITIDNSVLNSIILTQTLQYCKMQKLQKFVSGDRQLYQNWVIKRERIVGRGNSYVYEVQDEEKNIQCIKEIKLEDNMSQFIFRKQVQLLSKLKNQPHPHIVQFKGSYCLESKNHFKSRKGYIQMQKGITNLKQYLQHRSQKKQYFSQDDVLIFFNSMLDAFGHLQRCQLAHRDVKPSNILIFSLDPLFFKVCDVGAGTAVGVCDTTQNRTVIGTPYYLSPELFKAYRQKQNLTNYKVFKSDCYSLGLVFLQFLSLQRIGQRMNNQQEAIKYMITECKKRYQNIVGIGKVLRKMLDVNVKTRMDFLELQSYISQNQLLRNRINPQIQLSPEFLSKLKSQGQFFIQKFEDMPHLTKIASSGNTAPNIKIQLNSSNGFMNKSEKDYLQEIKNLKHVSLEEFVLKIEMCGLDINQVQHIQQAICQNKSLRVIKLDLWNNQIKNEGCIKIMKAIHSIIDNLEQLSLNFSSNKIRFNSSFKNLFNLQKTKKLKKLELRIGYNEMDNNYFQNFLEEVSLTENLQYLLLDFEKMNISHIHFNRASKSLLKMKNLKVFALNASNNQIRDEGVFGISEILEVNTELREMQILLRYAQFGDKGFSEFMKSISQNIKSLQRIKLNFLGNVITQKGLKTGLSSLENLTQITEIDINISHSKIEDLGMKFLGLALTSLKKLKKIRLVLDFTNITEKGCVYLGRMISQLDKLIHLDLSLKDNTVKLKGIQYICQGLLSTKKVRKLKIILDGTKIGDYAANYLAGCLLKMRCLLSVDLNMQNCDLTEATMQNITKLVKQCSNRAQQITISMRRNSQIKKQLYEQIKKQLSNSRFAIKVDNPSTLMQYSKTS